MIEQRTIDNLTESVKYGILGIKTLVDQRPAYLDGLNNVREKEEQTEAKLKFIETTKGFYVKAVDILYEESIGALKETLIVKN